MTYSLGDVGLLAETTVEANSIAHGHGLDTLATGDIGVSRVVEERGDKSRCVADVAGIVGTVQNVVLKDSSDGAGVVLDHAGDSGVIKEVLDGIVAWGQDGDIPKTAKVSEKTGLGTKKAYTVSLHRQMRYGNNIPLSSERVEFSDSRAAVRLTRLWAVA
jgi:hypothetical protein